MRPTYFLLLAAGLLGGSPRLACGQPATPPDAINHGYMQPATRPGNDFYTYANGSWVAQTTLPAEGYVMTSLTLAEQNTALFRRLLAQAVAHPDPADARQRQLSTFWQSAQHLEANRPTALAYVQAALADIDRIQSAAQLQQYLVRQNALASNKLVKLSGDAYDERSPLVRAQYSPAGIGLPAATYLTDDAPSRALLAGYQQLLAATFAAVGAALPNLPPVLALEKELAASQLAPAAAPGTGVPAAPVVPARDYSVAELGGAFPGISWELYARQYGLPDTTRYRLPQPRYYQRLSELLPTVPLAVWKDKLRVDYLLFNAPRVSDELGGRYFAFFEQQLKKSDQHFDRQVELTDIFENFYTRANLADVAGDVFARQVLPAADRQQVQALAENLRAVLRQRLAANAWLLPATRQAAVAKLDQLVLKVGYPDQLPNQEMAFVPDCYVRNYAQLYEHAQLTFLRAIGHPKVRTEWRRNQWSIAGSYQAEYNSIELVAGTLQPPFYQPAADEAVRYGTTGSLIAHELTHAFDKDGQHYTATGLRQPWWQPQDTLAFAQLTQPLAAQFSAYQVLGGTPLNGALSLGENTADLVGLQLAYEAFTHTAQFRRNRKIGGFTPTQRFLLAFAQQWRSKYTDAVLKEYFLQDVHLPDNIRVNGTLANFAPFYQACGVKPGDRLSRRPLVSIW